MPSLSTELRNRLAKAIQAARREAEAGARKALETLAVHHHEPHSSMGPGEQLLRRRLRAHGRQLGDIRDARGMQEIGRLTHEVSYGHWHRMLFARFLAENHLLIESDSGVSISMEECEELARERGEDPWGLASRFAHRMLPRIFRPDDPALEVALAAETRQALEHQLGALPPEIFTSSDALGWTYQFWQAEIKDAVNKSGVKIGADELPAVTQLFTEHYMVVFLFHNTIGAWWAGKVLAERPELAESAEDEEELRHAVRLGAQGGYGFDYLRFVRGRREGDAEGSPTGPWRPAAGTFEGWPRTPAELRVLDPCCGSGHFAVEGLELLVRLRMEEEDLVRDDAIRAVLADNLFGLEIDPRCTQIAAFNVALAAWKLAGRPMELPPLHIACSGLAPNATKDEWLAMAEEAAASGGMPVRRELLRTEYTLLSASLSGGLSTLHGLFEQAPELGSLIDPCSVKADLFQANFAALQPLLGAVLQRERGSEEQAERAVAAHGMALAAELLAGEYTLVITNVPYLKRGNQASSMRRWCGQHAAEAKACLSTTFLDRCIRFLEPGSTIAIVCPQQWLFLRSYQRFRTRILESETWNLLARLGHSAFTTISGQNVDVVLLALTRGKPPREGHSLDAASAPDPQAKARLLRVADLLLFDQYAQMANPESRIVFGALDRLPILSEFAASVHGQGSFDDPSYVRCFWEFGILRNGWILQQTSSNNDDEFGGLSNLFLWENGDGRLAAAMAAKASEGYTSGKWKAGRSAWGKNGVAISGMGRLYVNRYGGGSFDTNVAVVYPWDVEDWPAIWEYCRSSEFIENVRLIDRKPKVTPNTFAKVPFDRERWQRVAGASYANGLPEPQSDDPTQWLFHGHPARTESAIALQVAVARLLGYRWPPEQDPEMRLAMEARTWVVQCRQLDSLTDRDGIVCLSPLRGESGAADRLRRLLTAAFGTDWSAAKERVLLAAAGDGNATDSVEKWLRDCFFEEHCKLFHQRPFIWHVWDGRQDGFHALVNYHLLAGPDGVGRRTLEALAYSYLGGWIERQRIEQREGKEGSDARLAAAQDLQVQIERILFGEPPCDVFVRWKPLSRQPIGWEPDINDGVRLNIRPFLSAELRAGGRKSAGILRWKPNINWKKDRGKEPRDLRPREDFPWFWRCRGDSSMNECTDFLGGGEFDGNRWNDLHYTNATKRAARERGRDTTPVCRSTTQGGD